jgi:hypothetical protein
VDIKAFAVLVKQMRVKQKEFFDRNTRRPSTVGESKALEKAVDKAVSEILDDHPSLFGDDG